MDNGSTPTHGENAAGQDAKQAVETYETLAKIIDSVLLSPDLSEDQVAEECRIAREYQIGAVVVRPSDVDQVLRWMNGSGVAVASTAGHPDGSSITGTKLYEGRDLLRRGVTELDFTINIGKMISRQFQYVETELLQIAKSCQEAGAILKVDLASQFLTDELKIIATKIAKRVEAAYVSVNYNLQDLAVVRAVLKDRILMKASGGVENLAQAMEVREAGCTRIATSSPASILDDWKTHLAQVSAGNAAEG